ncbi:uncharacterized protein (TIGR00661 family) [Gillisia mitskevichiae]|uniref:Uncharacterized protein (TIGR00661 family) n=1 Tax=Gillisia mitskevichiae TaxID=270921 RepID=A0A495PYZ8_9FLAO|nr:glycosyltransferase [Gillisia mitskevichiae]RKS55843.1 uncharacterized protein (TIGR00661 family) [Gillisia mitskevichiae]
MPKKRILVAPLNWGLGHATRCIPIIHALILENFEPVIASDGDALNLLRKEFPSLEAHELPEYNISYSKKVAFFKLKLLLQAPKIIRVIKEEKERTRGFVETQNISGIISDNRWGVRHQNIPSIFITHQLNVLSGSSTLFSSKIQQKLIAKFTECWVPDFEDLPNLSGKMGHLEKKSFPVKYIGPISRFTKMQLPIKYRYAILLSGPEPQRGILEKILLEEFKNSTFPVIFIRGVLENKSKKEIIGKLSIYNFLHGKDLEEALNSSETIICRSGYTSVMDLAKLEKKAFLIPTPGQAEQEYLAEKLYKKGFVGSCAQNKFTFKKLDDLKNTTCLRFNFLTSSFSLVFSLFQGK